jgi:hypothetical protein
VREEEEEEEEEEVVGVGITFAFLALLPERQAGSVDGRAGTHRSRFAYCGAEREPVSRFKNDTK